MITIENRSAVRMDGSLVGYIPAERWQTALIALGATGGYRREDETYTATPMLRYRPSLEKTLKRLVA